MLGAFQPDMALPEELSIEIHAQVFHGDSKFRFPQDPLHLSLVFMHLANLGYGIHTFELNHFGPGCCTEVTLLRIWPEANGFS